MGVVDKGDAMINNNNSGQKKTASWSFLLSQVAKEINWPLLASISAHGVFFNAVLPRIGGDVQAQKIGATPVIELNPIEQTRLPNLDGMGILPPESQTPVSGENVIPLPPPPWETSQSPASNPPAVANNIPLPPPPEAASYDFSPLPPSNTSPSSQYDYQSSSPTPSPSPSPPLPPPPPVTSTTIASLPPEVPVGEYNDIPPPPATNKQQEILDEAKRAEIRRQLFANQPIEIAVNPRDVINNRNIKIDLRNQSALDLAKPEEKLKPTDTSTPTTLEEKVTANNPPMTGLEGDNTSDEVARRNYIAWARRVQNIRPKQLEFTGLYPPQACSGKWEGVASYGVVVNPEGKVSEAELLKSSGYPLLNETALKQIKSHQFENDTGNNTPYLVDVRFTYDSTVCAAANTSEGVGETAKTSEGVGETKKRETPPASEITQSEGEVKNSTSSRENRDNNTPDSAANKPSTDNPPPTKPALKFNPSATQPLKDNLPTIKPNVAVTRPSKDNPPVTLGVESKPKEANTTASDNLTPKAENTENTPTAAEKEKEALQSPPPQAEEETPPPEVPREEGGNY
ncbi:MAG: energy transducer TonB [Geminocystis sp.]|nr:energy transducer TonB [Geminocystis sp.]MCS7147372.1 energy transducer TonB [Geminocystis sp.]MDW8462639.1 TonB family protein [Geminocystis sp.]